MAAMIGAFLMGAAAATLLLVLWAQLASGKARAAWDAERTDELMQCWRERNRQGEETNLHLSIIAQALSSKAEDKEG